MSPRRVASSLLILVLALSVSPSVRAEDPEDILKVRPDALRGQDVESIVRKAHEAYAEQRYEDAARAFVRALRQAPGDSRNLYNLACCYGLLGHEGQAIPFLRAAWDAGFRDLAHIRRDPDFEKVRGSDRFAKLLVAFEADAERRRRAGGRVIPVVTKSVASVRVLAPEEMAPGSRYPLVIGLHGFGDNAESFLTLFKRREVPQDFIFCVPEAAYAFLPGQKIGYSWFLHGPEHDHRANRIAADLTRRYVLDVLETMKKEYPIDERNVFLMGFSQGAGLAFSVGIREPGRFRGVIPIGGWLDPKEYSPETVAKAAEHSRFLICHSPGDRVVPFEAAEVAVRLFAEHGIPHRLFRYGGGHTITAPVLHEMLAWMGLTPQAKPAEKAALGPVGTWTLDVEALRAEATREDPEAPIPIPEDVEISVEIEEGGIFRMMVRTASGGQEQREKARGTWKIDGDRLRFATPRESGTPNTKTGTLDGDVIRIDPSGDQPLTMTFRRR